MPHAPIYFGGFTLGGLGLAVAQARLQAAGAAGLRRQRRQLDTSSYLACDRLAPGGCCCRDMRSSLVSAGSRGLGGCNMSKLAICAPRDWARLSVPGRAWACLGRRGQAWSAKSTVKAHRARAALSRAPGGATGRGDKPVRVVPVPVYPLQ